MASRLQHLATRKHTSTPYKRPVRRSTGAEATEAEVEAFQKDKRSHDGSELSLRRIQQNLSFICAKYDRNFLEGEADVIDLNTMTIVKNYGHIKALPDRECGESLALKDPIDLAFHQPPEDYNGLEEPEEADSLAGDDDQDSLGDDSDCDMEEWSDGEDLEEEVDLINQSTEETDGETLRQGIDSTKSINQSTKGTYRSSTLTLELLKMKNPTSVRDKVAEQGTKFDVHLTNSKISKDSLENISKIIKKDDKKFGAEANNFGDIKTNFAKIETPKKEKLRLNFAMREKILGGKAKQLDSSQDSPCPSPTPKDAVERLTELFGRRTLNSPAKNPLAHQLLNSPRGAPPHSPQTCRKPFCLSCK